MRRALPAMGTLGVLVALLAQAQPELPAPVRANLRSVVKIVDFAGRERASGFLVWTRNGRALAMTNAHVTGTVTTAGMRLRFFDGQEAPVYGIAWQKLPLLDTALLAAALPETTAAAPARLRVGRVDAGEPVYTFDDGRLLEGSESEGGAVVRAVEGHTGQIKLTSRFHLPSLPGNSGRPIFSGRAHDVVALHWGSNRVLSSGVPAARIVADLKLELGAGRFGPTTAQAIREIIASARVAASP